MIELRVPEAVTAPLVVATAHPLDDPVAAARARVRLPLAAGLLNGPLLRIRTRAAGESGFADLIGAAAWVDPLERHLLDKADHHVVVTACTPPVSQPEHGQAARAVARAVAEACDGIVYDAWSHQVFPSAFRFAAEHPEFCLADDWLATFVDEEDYDHHIPAVPSEPPPLDAADDRAPGDLSGPAPGGRRAAGAGRPPSGSGGPSRGGGGRPPGGSGGDRAIAERGAHGMRVLRGGGTMRVVTAGLHRFALPELEAGGVPAGNVLAAVTLLRCLAVGLLSEHWDWLACNPGARSRRLPEHVWAEARDVWRYWAAEPHGPVDGRVRVRLRLTTGDGGVSLPYLMVGPPAGFGAPDADWWNDVVDLAMPYVTRAPRRMAA